MTGKIFAADRYQKMPYRRSGRSGLRLPEISLGFWLGIGEAGKEDVCRECMYYAFDHGVTHFDLANNYGPPPGNSEMVVGKILKDMPRDELIISTKAGYLMWDGPYGEWGSRKYLVASLDQSLKRLGLDYVDIFYHHRPDPDTPMEESLGTLELVVQQGKALYAGVSNYSGEQYCRAVQIMREHDWAPITIHQPRMNMFDRTPEWDLLPHTPVWGSGVIAFSPLERGILTDRYLDGLPADSSMGRRGEEGKRWYREQEANGTWNKVRKLNEIARARGQSMAQMAITWLLRHEAVTSVLIGASKAEQVVDCLGAANAPALSGEELQAIERILNDQAT